MTPEQARHLIEQALISIVPDARPQDLPGNADIRESLELDSLDFVELVERLSKGAGFRIEEDDYPRLRTMAAAEVFLTTPAPALA